MGRHVHLQANHLFARRLPHNGETRDHCPGKDLVFCSILPLTVKALSRLGFVLLELLTCHRIPRPPGSSSWEVQRSHSQKVPAGPQAVGEKRIKLPIVLLGKAGATGEAVCKETPSSQACRGRESTAHTGVSQVWAGRMKDCKLYVRCSRGTFWRLLLHNLRSSEQGLLFPNHAFSFSTSCSSSFSFLPPPLHLLPLLLHFARLLKRWKLLSLQSTACRHDLAGTPRSEAPADAVFERSV